MITLFWILLALVCICIGSILLYKNNKKTIDPIIDKYDTVSKNITVDLNSSYDSVKNVIENLKKKGQK